MAAERPSAIALDPAFHVHDRGHAVAPEAILPLEVRYDTLAPGYCAILQCVAGAVLLSDRRSERRSLKPEEIVGKDAAYGVSPMSRSAMPIGDNGSGELLIAGNGHRGAGLYLVDAGALFPDEDAVWLGRDRDAILTRGENAEAVFRSVPIYPWPPSNWE